MDARSDEDSDPKSIVEKLLNDMKKTQAENNHAENRKIKSDQIILRISPVFKKYLQSKSKAEDISLSHMIIKILREKFNLNPQEYR